MSEFFQVSRISLPEKEINKAYEHMRRMGQNHVEGVALFAGKKTHKHNFNIVKTIIPKQKLFALEEGLLYQVDGDELHRINMNLYESGLTLIAQIHSHPRLAYHSLTDDLYPMITTLGGISIVVPNFAAGPVSIDTWAVYRLIGDRRWAQLDEIEKAELIELI